jgi:heme exporter protein A
LTTFESNFEYPTLTLEANALTCVRGGREVFRDLSFEVRSGEMMKLVGPNGSGKSSLLRQIAGLLELNDGSLMVSGGGERTEVATQALYAGHLDAVKAPLSVYENLRFWADFYDSPQTRVQMALEGFSLDRLSTLPADVLSAGQKKRLGLARLLVTDRPLWLLDEPTVSLDTASIANLGELMKAHLARGGVILSATHVDLGIEAARTLSFDGART